MALLLREELSGLLRTPRDPSVSLFSPMVQAGPDTRQNPTRIKNLLREAAAKLGGLGMSAPQAREFLEPAWELVDNAAYWQQQADGLALFRDRETFRAYRLPLEFDQVVVVGSTFHVKPLLPLLTGDGRFYILAVSENEVRLYSATRHSIGELQVEDLPASLAEVLRFDIIEPSPQVHSVAPAVAGTLRPGAAPVRSGWMHGHGEPKDLEKEHIERFFRRIDQGLHDLLKNERAPLVLAGVRYFLPIYQSVNSYPHLLDGIVEGNPEKPRKSLHDLHHEAWTLVEPVFRRSQEESADLCRMAINQGKGSNDLAEVVRAAHHSRVDRLFVPVGIEAWGTYNPADDSVRLNPSQTAQPGEEDLLNLAAIQTYLKGGTVFAVNPDQMPVADTVAATFRF